MRIIIKTGGAVVVAVAFISLAIIAVSATVRAKRTQAPKQSAAAITSDAPSHATATTSAAWSYGYGGYDASKKQVGTFVRFPFSAEGQWSGSSIYPDPQLGYLLLTARGGHPGGDLKHCVVRRWTAPDALRVRVSGVLRHEPQQGDGVDGMILSGASGLLGSWAVHHGQITTAIPHPILVRRGENIDFLVSCRKDPNYDAFSWVPTIQEVEGGRREWRSDIDFSTR